MTEFTGRWYRFISPEVEERIDNAATTLETTGMHVTPAFDLANDIVYKQLYREYTPELAIFADSFDSSWDDLIFYATHDWLTRNESDMKLMLNKLSELQTLFLKTFMANYPR